MDLIPYDSAYIPKGNGFVNLGATCYFNSLMQGLLSCSSIYQVLAKIRNTKPVKSNPTLMKLIKLWDSAMAGESRVGDLCVPIWRDIIAISQRQQTSIKMDEGQQDAHEGLMMFLDIIDDIPELRRLFEHRYRTKVYCDTCEKYIICKYEENLTFEVQASLTNEQLAEFKHKDKFYGSKLNLNDFLMKQNEYIDADHVCSTCGAKCAKFKTNDLVMVPEILPIIFKKYKSKELTAFSEYLEFPSVTNNKKFVYKLVAQVEHSGGMHGGHYWAIGLRRDSWKTLNDCSVSAGQPGPTPNTYMVFYHFDSIQIL